MALSPRQFYQKIHPEKFSDSVVVTQGKLTRSMLEYYLSSVTSRNQERQFETFAVNLAQYEICPQLRPQTGPVGGGDSKVDSETIPVSEFTALNYYEGIANEKNDRWAFAVSAKKDWVSKVKNDVKSAVSTGRSYQKIFFITNQFARDKKRAEIEDALTTLYSIQVTILDLNWILDRVFRNNRQQLAIEALELDEGMEDEISMGPSDYDRAQKFSLLNAAIEKAIATKQVGLHTIEDSLEAAILARGMGRTRTEVDGLFDRGIRLARQFQSTDQLYSVLYHKAWTTFFWFEDVVAFMEMYDILETIAADSGNIHTIERQNNLWQILSSHNTPEFSIDPVYLEKKTANLKALLTKASLDETRPTAALQAKTHLLLNELLGTMTRKEDAGNYFESLGDIITQSESLIGFPYETIIDLIQSLGEVFGDYQKYESLILRVIEIDTTRKGQVSTSKSLFKFGFQHFEAGRIYKAIDYIGRSLSGLYKEETRNDFVMALHMHSHAYEAAGLLWAAWGSAINAASIANKDFILYQKFHPAMPMLLRRLEGIELRFGRMGMSLEWNYLHKRVASELAKTLEERKKIFEESYYFYASLIGCLFLKTPGKVLSQLEYLPDSLVSLELNFAAYALLYKLGGKKYLPEGFTKKLIANDPDALFSVWMDQPDQQQLPAEPDYYLDETVLLKSKILGTKFIISAPNKSPAVEIAEILLAIFESFISTSIENAWGKYSQVDILLREKENTQNILQLREDDQQIFGKFIVEYSPFDPRVIKTDTYNILGHAIFDILNPILKETIFFKDAKQYPPALFTDENVIHRSLFFLNSIFAMRGILDHAPRRSITSWLVKDAKRYPYLPDESGQVTKQRVVNTMDQEPMDKEQRNKEAISHADMTIISPILPDLWAKARWKGTGYLVDDHPTSSHPLILYLIFADKELGKSIFNNWQDVYKEQAGRHLHITILRGINKNQPSWYKVLIGPGKAAHDKSLRALLVFQLLTMSTPSNVNLERFMDAFAKTRKFFFIPGYYYPSGTSPELYKELGTWCSNFEVKAAWEIGLGDYEALAIQEGDDPIIPPDIKDAPVLKLLEHNRQKR